jgi:hypothetical protein
MKRHRHQEFIRFLNTVEFAVPFRALHFTTVRGVVASVPRQGGRGMCPGRPGLLGIW